MLHEPAPGVRFSNLGHSSVGYDGRIWVLGGARDSKHGFKDVWSSVDGSTWVSATSDAPWGPRSGHASVVYGDKLWIIGGQTHSDAGVEYKNDAWFSSDGTHWTRMDAKTAFSPRDDHACVVFQQAIWVLGGGQSYEAPTNEIWTYTAE